MTRLAVVVAVWVGLSVPTALVCGVLLRFARRGEQPARPADAAVAAPARARTVVG